MLSSARPAIELPHTPADLESAPIMTSGPTDNRSGLEGATRPHLGEGSLVHSQPDLRRSFFLISTGLFITTLGQPGVIGLLPFRFLFKNQFHLNASEQANFFAVATFAWYMKPLAGLLCDSFPLFGTRRRSYLMLAAGFAGVTWSLFAVAPRSVRDVLLADGGPEHRHGDRKHVHRRDLGRGRPGGPCHRPAGIRPVRHRWRHQRDSGAVGGWLATRRVRVDGGHWRRFCSFLCAGDRSPLESRPVARRNSRYGRRRLAVSPDPPLQDHVGGGGLLLLVFIAPAFGTALTYYQQDVLLPAWSSSVVCKRCPGLGGILATGLYAYYCPKMSLATASLGRDCSTP